jgi:F-box protein 21
MLDTLPTELVDHLFRLYPASRTSDASVRALATCGVLSRRLRAVATQPALWEAHYRARYTAHDAQAERARRVRWADDWCTLYARRRAADAYALRLLDDLESYNGGLDRRHECAAELVGAYSYVFPLCTRTRAHMSQL